jgi:hypothetical protein
MFRLNPLRLMVLAGLCIVAAANVSASLVDTVEVPRPPISSSEIRCAADCAVLQLQNPALTSLGLPTDVQVDLGRVDEVQEVIRSASAGPVPVWVNVDGTGYTVLDPGPLVETSRPLAWWLLLAVNAFLGFVGGSACLTYLDQRSRARRAHPWAQV